MMRAEDVLQILAALDSAGVSVWVNGGWGVDALLGAQTRLHDDLDVFISDTDIERSIGILSSLGFAMSNDERPKSYVLRDPSDRRVDFHPLSMQPDGSGAQTGQNGELWVLPAAGFRGRGTIGKQAVRCVAVEEQVREHLGYEPREADRADMLALAVRFRLALPAPFDHAQQAGTGTE